MLVYGDRARATTPRQMLREITSVLRAAEAAQPGPGRHDLLTHAFIEAACLTQGVADAEFEARGADDLSMGQDACLALLLMLARKLTASAWSGFAAIGPGVAPELMSLAVQPLPEAISVRTPEGYAFYAVYPEAYLKAAAEHPWPATPLVIGLRSIGTGLAALVAAVTGARTVITLRPCGHPFRRELRVSDQLRGLLAAHDGPFAIVDEGPGLSGSSFGATADLLESLGVAEDRIVFLPSHRGDLGPEADPRHRARWSRAARPVATFEDLAAELPLADWFADLTGRIEAVEDLSGGAWRSTLALPAEAMPPANAAQEQLKFRLRTASGWWLAKFAGLGATGAAKFERAKALHRAGFTPEPLALRRGFILEHWEDGAPGAAVERARLVEHLAAYLAFRAAALPVEPGCGASLDELGEMTRVNLRETLGPGAEARVGPRLEAAAAAPPARPVHIDGRLHAWEWRLTPDDLLLKTDAVDHSCAHDLVGCQEIGWDVAGARLEFDLDDEETAHLCDAVEQATGERPDPARLAFFDFAYPAFQAGWWRMAEEAAAAEERARLGACVERYVRRLAKLAGAPESAD
ncbi:MAG: hypothetical protein JWQ97_1768 [Phenylobacterium sp.]|nr:hypothetical protein [Phenylobacterium sp.]